MPTAIFCGDCQASGSVPVVTASLRCRCGSDNLGLDGVDPKPSVVRTAAKTAQLPGLPPTSQDRSGFGHPHPNPTTNWNEYTGPPPGPNPNPVSDSPRWPCPNCQGAGYDLPNKSPCKACGGTGHHLGPTQVPKSAPLSPRPGPPVGGARWQASRPSRPVSGQRVSYPGASPSASPAVSPYPTYPPRPLRGSASSSAGVTGHLQPGPQPTLQPTLQPNPGGSYRLTASCPACRAPSTVLAPDARGHAWWSCRCGSLADLDARPELDPFAPPLGLAPDRRMRTKAAKLRRNRTRPDGRLLALLGAVAEHNAVSVQEALGLARATVARYPG
jgi:hypothetical protein